MKVFDKQLNHTLWQRVERVVFLLALIVLALDLYVWRP
jgi:hypothetical protein